MKQLYLFTASYPYDRAETFLEDEIRYLADVFDKITIIPLFGMSITRNVPPICKVWAPIEKNGIKRYFNLFIPNKATLFFIMDFFSKRVYLSKIRLKTWIVAYRQASNLMRNKHIKELFSKINYNDVCYFYWGKGSVILSALNKGKVHFVSRFHGEWDLWEESSDNYAPLRKKIAESLTLAAFISKKGENYFKERYSISKTAVYPLGSFDKGICKKSCDGVLRIVSCSAVYPLKRVPLIFKALYASNLEIEWTHIGGGEQYDELKESILHSKREGLKVILLGQISHDEVLKYYETHIVDMFINMSTNEGIPVSIMEAISFDIPVIATNVGATSEVVCEDTGKLLSPNPSIDEIVEAINEVYNNRYGKHPRAFWQQNYDASINYKKFADTISSLV